MLCLVGMCACVFVCVGLFICAFDFLFNCNFLLAGFIACWFVCLFVCLLVKELNFHYNPASVLAFTFTCVYLVGFLVPKQNN